MHEPKVVLITDVGLGARSLAACALALRHRNDNPWGPTVPVIVDSKVLQRSHEQAMREFGCPNSFDYLTPQRLVRMGPQTNFPAPTEDVLFHMDHFRNPKTYSYKQMAKIVHEAKQGIMVIHAQDHLPSAFASMFAPHRAWVGLDRREVLSKANLNSKENL